MNRRFFSRTAALGAALCFAALYAAFASSQPKEALAAFFIGPFETRYAFFSLLESSASLLCCALGAVLAFRAGAFNLGGEGQAAIGTLAAALVAQALGNQAGLMAGLGIIAALAASSLSGAALAFMSERAEHRTGTEIMLTSFLIGQTAIIVIDWAVAGPLKDPAANLLGMAPIPSSFKLPLLASPSPLSLAFPLAAALALGLIYFTRFSRAGIRQRLWGKSRDFALALGYPPRIGAWSMAASGALAGLGGGLLVLGQAGRAVKDMTGGIGWNGLAVALIAGTDGLAALPVALFFAWLDIGARQASILADLSPDSSLVMEGIALFLITATFSLAPRHRERRKGEFHA